MTVPEPKVFIDYIKETPNQTLYHINYMKEFMGQQKKQSDLFVETYTNMKNDFLQNYKKQNETYFQVIHHLENQFLTVTKLLLLFQEQQNTSNLMNEQLASLVKSNEKLIHSLQMNKLRD